MITFNYYDYKRESFTTEDIMDKERTLRNMMKPNTWKEIEDMVLSAGFNTVQPLEKPRICWCVIYKIILDKTY